MKLRTGDVGLILGLAAVYIVVARIGLTFDAVAGFATLVWPPTGISIAAIVLLGTRLWPGVFVGALVANLLTGATPSVAAGIALGNTLEAVAGAYLLRSTSSFSRTLETVESTVVLILVALSCTIISASVGVACLYFGGVMRAPLVGDTWRAWWIGDMVGAMTATPVILVWSSAPRVRFEQHWLEVVALAVSLVVVCKITFFGDHVPLFATPFHQTNLLFAVLVWAALRFGQRGAVTASSGVATSAVVATILGHGPFVHPNLSASLLSLQTFIATTDATLLLLGATIAERRAAVEESDRAHTQAESANLAKSEFLAVMSHELRTPLNGIAGFAELLQEGIYGSLNSKQLDAVTRIHRSEQHLLSLIDEVLGFVSVEKGHVEVQREDIRVADAFDAVEPLIQPQMRSKHFVLKRDLPAGLLAVRADRKGLEQILISLLSNASKYTGEGGTITIGADRDGATVRVWVRDTGVGISPGELQRVFEPFFQAERGKTRRDTGVGLGLTMARELARRMDGEIEITSQLGMGTTASLTLPAA